MKLPDPRPSKSNTEARAHRKALEKENPHFNMQEFGMKAGALALLTAVALFPWEKEYEKHERNHHPERFQDEKNGNSSKDRRGSKKDGDDRRGRGQGRDGDRRRRQSEGGERQREYRQYLDRDREYRVADDLGDGSTRGTDGRRYTGSEDGEYGRRYVAAPRREMERRDKGSVGDDYRRRRRASVDYEYGRGSRDDRRQ